MKGGGHRAFILIKLSNQVTQSLHYEYSNIIDFIGIGTIGTGSGVRAPDRVDAAGE